MGAHAESAGARDPLRRVGVGAGQDFPRGVGREALAEARVDQFDARCLATIMFDGFRSLCMI